MNITRNRDIDRMRGLTVFLMLIVNSPVDLRITNSAFMHSGWAGLTLADTVFPTFLFIVGISISLANRVNKQTLNSLMQRAILLIVAGMSLKAMVFFLFDQEHYRFMGVLQRIGICYAVAGLMYRYMNIKILQAICLILISGWTIALISWGDYNQYSNISDVVDNSVLGVHANYYDIKTGRYGDSEGLLSTIGGLITTLAGVIFGEQINKISNAKIFSYGAACIMAGAALYYFCSMPVIKKIWTPSFLLICLGITIWLYLSLKIMAAAAINLSWLEFPGRHSLAIYILSIIAFDVLLWLDVWHSLFVVVYTYLIPRGIPLQTATLLFSLLFSSVLCFTPTLIQKTMVVLKRAV